MSILLEVRATVESASWCPAFNSNELKFLELLGECEGTSLHNPVISQSVGCSDFMILDNSTGGAEKCCKFLVFYIILQFPNCSNCKDF